MRYLIRNNVLNRQQRRAQYATTSRSKPLCKPRNPTKKTAAVIIGHNKIEKFIARGISINAKVIGPNKLALAVRRGINSFTGAFKNEPKS